MQLLDAALGWAINWHRMYCDRMTNVVHWQMNLCLPPHMLLLGKEFKREKNMSHASEWMGLAVHYQRIIES